MQQLTIQARSPESAFALLDALRQLGAAITADDEGRCSVSVEIGNERHAIEVLDAVRKHFAGRVGDGPVTVLTVVGSDRDYSTRVR